MHKIDIIRHKMVKMQNARLQDLAKIHKDVWRITCRMLTMEWKNRHFVIAYMFLMWYNKKVGEFGKNRLKYGLDNGIYDERI